MRSANNNTELLLLLKYKNMKFNLEVALFQMAERLGCTLSQLFLAWSLRNNTSQVQALRTLRYTSMKFFFAETETIWSQGPVTRDF
jgi:hypothetical protein